MTDAVSVALIAAAAPVAPVCLSHFFARRQRDRIEYQTNGALAHLTAEVARLQRESSTARPE